MIKGVRTKATKQKLIVLPTLMAV